MNRVLLTLLLVAVASVLFAGTAQAVQLPDLSGLTDAMSAIGETAQDVAVDTAEQTEGKLSQALEIVLLLTALSLLPAALISVTCFTRIVIVLSFVRRSLSVNELPPNPVILGLALFLTSFVMAPVFERMYESAYVPYEAGEMPFEEAASAAWHELSGFLISNTRESEIQLFRELSGNDSPESESEMPFTVIVPAFVLSELKTAFQMGFLLFLPFLVIDLVVSSVLLSMGMFMLPPVTISTPFKILLFVLVDGWSLVCQSLVTSFVTG
ncbi:Flagellar biosynthetic protein FliP precursor [Planctomycetes bacterium Pla163]|uniref:Flagellar biosynthetic protein FliP n=1 Tax=Rohdeia mirabilis TaxID=2528008 RepID=A0A518D4R9_9BACT|nr:Flagellar biosynthetic protein FliP precursor [Planctomycetes bacterium Pla163]